MRRTRPSAEHQQAVSRRLELLADQLAAEQLSAERAAPIGATGEESVDPAAGGEWWSGHTRVATRPLRVLEPSPDEAVAQPQPQPVLVAVPGRHASRRPGSAVRSVVPEVSSGLLPETLRGRLRVGPAHLAVVALLVAVGLAITCWRVVSADAEPPMPAIAAEPAAGLLPVTGATPPSDAGLTDPTAPPAAPADPAVPAAPAAATTVTVDVAGEVRRPGIVVLDSGARVIDALEQAGGPRPSVDLTSLNLARELVDGEQILVGVDPPPGWTPGGTTSGAVPGSTGTAVPGVPAALVDLNLAGLEELDTLPGVGPVTAAAIVAWREENGGFTAVTELLEVNGIGDVTLAELTPLVTV